MHRSNNLRNTIIQQKAAKQVSAYKLPTISQKWTVKQHFKDLNHKNSCTTVPTAQMHLTNALSQRQLIYKN